MYISGGMGNVGLKLNYKMALHPLLAKKDGEVAPKWYLCREIMSWMCSDGAKCSALFDDCMWRAYVRLPARGPCGQAFIGSWGCPPRP